MYEIASLSGERPISLHCLSATSALCALYEMTVTVPESDVAVSFDGVDVSAADLRSRALAELGRDSIGP